jgi:hypothetical protein
VYASFAFAHNSPILNAKVQSRRKRGGERGMTVLIGIFLLVMGLFFVGMAVLLAVVMDGGLALANLFTAGAGASGIFIIVGGLMAVVGLVLTVTGRAAAQRQKAKAMLIYQTGVAAEATVTFVDRNYRILVNNRPIYSIVEFKFRDTSGVEHVERKDTVDSELVIRNQIEVGSTVNIKYLAEDPSQNILMLADPSATT